MSNRFAHEVIAKVRNVLYGCKRCSFQGDLSEAIFHVVENQYDARD